MCWVNFSISFLIFCFRIVLKLSDYSYLLSKRTFPRSTCRYSVLLLALAHQYFFPFSLAYLANSSALTEEAVIWRSLISPFCIPSGSTQSISIRFITMYCVERKVYANFLFLTWKNWMLWIGYKAPKGASVSPTQQKRAHPEFERWPFLYKPSR